MNVILSTQCLITQLIEYALGDHTRTGRSTLTG